MEAFGGGVAAPWRHLRSPAPAGTPAYPLFAPPVHLATLYSSDAGRLRITGPLLIEGLRRREPCFLIASGAILEFYFDHLRAAAGVDLDAALAEGDLVIGGAPGATIQAALDYWEDRFWGAITSGAKVIRVAAEMTCERELFGSEREMLNYEAALNMTSRRFPCVVVCQYDARQFSGEALLDALRAHPDLHDRPLGSILLN